MKNMKSLFSKRVGAVAIFAGLIFGSSPAIANEAGMFLCVSPSFSGDLWTNLVNVEKTGVLVTREIATGMAARLGCKFVASKKLRPTAFVPNEFRMTDGHISGWANVNLYIIYANRNDMK